MFLHSVSSILSNINKNIRQHSATVGGTFVNEKDKILIAKLILKITSIMIIISIGLKLLGFDFFEADSSNKMLLIISNFIDNFKIKPLFNFVILLVQAFIFFQLSCKNKNRKTYYASTILTVIFTITSQLLIYDFFWVNNQQLAAIIYYAVSFGFLIFTVLMIDIKIKYKNNSKNNNKFFRLMGKIRNRMKRPILILLILTAYQLIALFLRSLTPAGRYNTLYNFLLNFDYIILLLSTYYLFLKKENNLVIRNNFEFALAKFLNQVPAKKDLKYMVEGWKDKYSDFKKQSKTEKVVFILYILFFIIEECLTLGILFFIANLNNYVIECVFILSAFLIAKKTFGAFHFQSFILCFFVSNTTFFILSKLTMKVSFTFVIPIICGIFLSYIASKFIKKVDPTPYRGMPEKDLTKLCETKNLNKVETGILIDYYSNRFNLDKIAFKYNYSDRNIQRIKSRALQKIEV